MTAENGLEAVRTRRLKISRIEALNDPFELLSVDLGSEKIRHAFTTLKKQLSASKGLLCFSESWSSPILWSHYAERHRGVCLGFELADRIAIKVSYSARRLFADTDQLLEQLHPRSADRENIVVRLLTTKFSHWRYEQEVRCFLSLDQAEHGLYFADFSSDLKLTHIIVGPQSAVSRSDVSVALYSFPDKITQFKSRLAFKSFRVVRNRNQKLWK